jgi:hypothetical protein
MTLKAPPTAGRTLDAKKQTGDHLSAVHPPARSKDEIKRRAKEFAEFRRKQAAEQAATPVYPTAERMAKEAIPMKRETVGVGSALAPARRYTVKAPVDQYELQWEPARLYAYRQFAQDYEAQQTFRITPNYEGTGGGSPHNRMGGYGPDDYLRDASERFEYVRDKLNDDEWKAIYWLVLDGRHSLTGKNLTWQDVGSILFPHIKDKASSKGIAIGHLNSAGATLVKWYRIWKVMHTAEIGARESHPRKVVKLVTPHKMLGGRE